MRGSQNPAYGLASAGFFYFFRLAFKQVDNDPDALYLVFLIAVKVKFHNQVTAVPVIPECIYRGYGFTLSNHNINPAFRLFFSKAIFRVLFHFLNCFFFDMSLFRLKGCRVLKI